MPKKKIESTPKEEFVATTPSEAFYKCFMFKDQAADMIVDTSGDTFSWSLGDALRSMFNSMDQSTLMAIPNRTMLIGDDQVAYDHDFCNENLSRVVIIQLKAHEVSELEAAKSDATDIDFRLELRKMPAGYVVALQEYNIQTIVMESKSPNAPFAVTRCELVVDNVDTMSPMFPENLTIF